MIAGQLEVSDFTAHAVIGRLEVGLCFAAGGPHVGHLGLSEDWGCLILGGPKNKDPTI